MLIMMCGPSYSGKSTLAKEYAEKYNATIVATDDIREELFGSADVQKDHDKVFALAYVRIGSLLAARKGYDYVDFEAARFNASAEVLVKYFTNLNYRCRYRYLNNELVVSWDGADKD